MVKVRPNALSRFTLFTSYEVIKDDQVILETLHDSEFPALRTVILNNPPGIPQSEDANPEPLTFKELSSDVIQVVVDTPVPGIVLFNDTYHPNWKAFVNGQLQPVLKANYNFMAVAVPAGQNQVVFRFQPQFFRYGLYLAGVGFLMFISIAATLYHFKDQLDPRPNG